MDNNNILDQDRAYERYGSMLLSLLANLARQGLVVQPSDSLELVHDFFAEQWANLKRTYNPEKGAFSTYLYSAFRHFSRPRIIKLQRWQNCLSTVDELSYLSERKQWQYPSPENTVDLQKLSLVISELPAPYSTVLTYRVQQGLSERDTAQELNWTRYRVREVSAEALGRIMVALNENHVVSQKEWTFALLLWKDNLSVYEAADILDIPVNQAKSNRTQLLNSLNYVLNEIKTPDNSHQEQKVNRRKIMDNKFCDFWYEFVNGNANIDEVSSFKNLVDHVVNCSTCSEVAIAEEKIPALLSMFSEALTDVDDTADEIDSLELQTYMQKEYNDIDTHIEHAVTEVLLPAVGDTLEALSTRIADITPVKIFLSIDAVAMLIDRYIHLEMDSDSLEMTVLIKDTGDQKHQIIFFNSNNEEVGALTLNEIQKEIQEYAEVAETSAKLLWGWVIKAAKCVPKLFPSLDFDRLKRSNSDYDHVTGVTFDIAYRPVPRDETLNLIQRWRPFTPLTPRSTVVTSLDSLFETRQLTENHPHSKAKL